MSRKRFTGRAARCSALAGRQLGNPDVQRRRGQRVATVRWLRRRQGDREVHRQLRGGGVGPGRPGDHLRLGAAADDAVTDLDAEAAYAERQGVDVGTFVESTGPAPTTPAAAHVGSGDRRRRARAARRVPAYHVGLVPAEPKLTSTHTKSKGGQHNQHTPDRVGPAVASRVRAGEGDGHHLELPGHDGAGPPGERGAFAAGIPADPPHERWDRHDAYGRNEPSRWFGEPDPNDPNDQRPPRADQVDPNRKFSTRITQMRGSRPAATRALFSDA